jgi:hypothetical protein
MQVAAKHLQSQESILGLQHCDVAATLDVLQATLDYMLAHAPQALFAAFPDSWSTFGKASRAQYAYSQRCKALKDLYSRDVHTL